MAQVSVPTPSSPAEIRETVQTILASDGLPPIVQVGHPALRQSAARYDGQLTDEELAALIDLMRRVMHNAPGVGLAAPQLGIPLQIAVAEDAFDVEPDIAGLRERTPLDFLVLLNPSYIAMGAGRAAFYEGCLSLNGLQAVVPRPDRVQLTYTTQEGTAMQAEYAGWQARIVQHETDHLHGTLYVDKAELRSLTTNEEYGLRWMAPDISRARQELGFLPD